MLLEVGGLQMPGEVSTWPTRRRLKCRRHSSRSLSPGWPPSPHTRASTRAPQHGKPPEELARCTKAAWSPTGHLLALASSQAGHEVLIFSPLHRSLLARLRGHYSAVLDLCWSQDGLYLASTSEGAVYTWHMEDFTRREENTAKGCFNSAVACTPDFGTLVVGDASQVSGASLALRRREASRTGR